MLPDFAEVYGDFISDDGTVNPPISFIVPDVATWTADPDGLLMTTLQMGLDGEPCLLSVLFPMPQGAACAKHRQRRFPAKAVDAMTVVRRLDEVVGQSGERYTRFIVDVVPAARLTSTASP